MNKTIKIIVVTFSLILFLISLFQECYVAEGRESLGSLGLVALLMGWMNFSTSFLSWFANPLYLLTIISIFKNKKNARTTGILSLLFSLSFLILNEVLIDEAGNTGKVEKYLLGYWLWTLSITIVAVCSILNKSASVNIGLK
jgi:hypothetical protein